MRLRDLLSDITSIKGVSMESPVVIHGLDEPVQIEAVGVKYRRDDIPEVRLNVKDRQESK